MGLFAFSRELSQTFVTIIGLASQRSDLRAASSTKMSIEDRLRRIVTALPDQASVTLPVSLVKEWLEMEADDPLEDLTVADVARQLRRSPGTVRDWIRRGELEAYQLGKEYRVTRPALTTFCQRQRNGPRTSGQSETAPSRRSDLGGWRKVRRRRGT